MRSVRAIHSVLALALFAVAPLAAGTSSASVDGFVGPGDPSMLVALISTPNCTGGYGSVDVFYDLYPLTVGASGTYHVEVLSDSGTTAFYVYANSFNPGAAADNCIAASNSGNPQMVDIALAPGTQYYVGVIDDTFAQEGHNYTLSVDGPGAISLGSYAPAQEIPTLSTWGLAALGLVLAIFALTLLRRRSLA